jgi:two-component system, OmpR family, KDP operon response regulator KdpE
MMDNFQTNHLRVTIICDDPDTGFTWSSLLRSKGLDVFLSNGPLSPKKSEEASPDLIIIDETTSKFNGVNMIKELKTTQGSLIFYLSSQNDETYLLQAYQAGADDCVAKPISPAHFLYRIRALLRRVRTVPVTGAESIKTSDISLDTSRRMVINSSGKEIRLSQLEFRLLHLLISSPGRIFTSEQIITAVWGYSGAGDQRLLKHLVFRLRQKIEEDPKEPKYILNETGVGYKFTVG